ncbi:MAG TPA: hypothetical protein VFW46_04710 [Stellaceae bacterium]|nr:hypothetical protein [Stellaceae bacterium]
MLYFVVGLPGHFSAWCDAVVAAFVRAAYGDGPILAADNLPELAAAAIRAGVSHGVVSCRRPGGWLRGTLTQAERRFILAFDDPRLALADLGDDIAAATSLVASSCAAISSYDGTPGGLTIRGDEAAADPIAAADAIAAHLGLAGDTASIVAELAEQGIVADAAAARARWHELDSNPRAWAEGALAPYITYFDTGHLTPITWARELFFLGDRPSERASWIVDITGRARCLIQGPGIMIAPGNWLAVVKLLFSREATEHEFQVELHSDRMLGEAAVRPEREGGLEVSFPLSIEETANHPLTVLLSNRRAAFDGACAMDNVVLMPQDLS